MFSEEEFQAMMLDQDDLGWTPLFSSEDALQPQVQAAQSAVDDKEIEPPPPPPSSGESVGKGEAEPAAAPRRRGKRRSSKKRRKRQQMLRSWHRWIATCILTRQFRAPDLSGGRTALRCMCLELAGANVEHHRGRRACALHEDNAPGREWIHEAHGGGVPLLCGGPGEVRVPTLAAGDSAVEVVQYARWRRSVWLPTRFYVQRAVERKVAGFEFEEPGDDDWMMDG